MSDQALETQCCIAGGGPAGMMLGLAAMALPVLRRVMARVVGRGFQPETLGPELTLKQPVGP
jgi:hypothetical protein